MELPCSPVGRVDSQAAVVGSQAAVVGSQAVVVGSQAAVVDSQAVVVGSQAAVVDSQAAVVGCQSFRGRPAVGVAVGGIGLQGGQEAVVLVVWLNSPVLACLKLIFISKIFINSRRADLVHTENHL